ncbi:hypothetical protein AVEN_59471-1 [Araneus ventricosus]|uniref:Uncharacterized protein n=1 Tax=Araneus ventricosus TaxID=182803 RepID=A0A4Y2JGC1_ARAVE|nr:hypothetical protein AVEN_59471-1 [Araneus ventricosus]
MMKWRKFDRTIIMPLPLYNRSYPHCRVNLAGPTGQTLTPLLFGYAIRSHFQNTQLQIQLFPNVIREQNAILYFNEINYRDLSCLFSNGLDGIVRSSYARGQAVAGDGY